MTEFASWLHDNAIHADTVDPNAALDDLEPLRALIGDARVVAVGENSHHIRQFYRVRHRLLRFLVERCGFTVLAFETAFMPGFDVDTWVRGGPGDVSGAAHSAGMLADCREMRDLLLWMRHHNREGGNPVGFAGTVAAAGGGLNAELRHVADYLAAADPPALGPAEAAIAIGDPWQADNPMQEMNSYLAAEDSVRDRLTALLSRLTARLDNMAAYQATRGRARQHAEASSYLNAARRADLFHRDLSGKGFDVGTTNLDAFMAEAVLEILDRDPKARIVLALHNVHIRRTSGGEATGHFPAGYRLAQSLGDDYLSMALTSNNGQLVTGTVDAQRKWGFATIAETAPAPEPGSIEAAFDTTSPLNFA
ncbi:MAG: erythromycin esterase family protein, partial [Stackebrandtia sp.]